MTANVLLVVQTLVCAGVCVAILRLLRQITKHSPTIGNVVAVGILVRAVTGAVLFWISYLDLPVLRSLHLGGGFWQLALDARSYFEVAASAVDGLTTISSDSASPAYTRALAGWMLLTGVSPASGAFMNLAFYVVVCRAIVAAASIQRVPERWTMLPIAALTFSPALLVFGTQPLKDNLFAFLVAICSLAWLMMCRPAATQAAATWNRPALGSLAVILASVYGIAGMRAYFAVFVWLSAAAAIALIGWQLRRAQLPRFAAVSAATLAALWLSFWAGAGPYYPLYSPARLWQSTTPASSAMLIADNARDGFVQTGGATNIVTASDGRVRAFVRGLAVMFVPISLLKLMGVVDFDGGRGLLLLTDVDTLFIDALILLSLAALVVHRATLSRNLGPVTFLLVLSGISTVLMAYVVTNYGTLFRLRLMVTVPLWLLPVVIARSDVLTDARQRLVRAGISSRSESIGPPVAAYR